MANYKHQNPMVGTRVTPEEKEQLEELARKQGRNVSQLIGDYVAKLLGKEVPQWSDRIDRMEAELAELKKQWLLLKEAS